MLDTARPFYILHFWQPRSDNTSHSSQIWAKVRQILNFSGISPTFGTHMQQLGIYTLVLKETSSRKKFSSNERAWKIQKIEPSPTSMSRLVLEIFHLKSGILARWTSPFCRFSASILLKYDVTDAMLQNNEKWKCSISGVFCLICLKLCRLLELGKGISLHFNFRCYGNQN